MVAEDRLQIVAANVPKSYEMCNSARIFLWTPDGAEIDTRVFERIFHDDKWHDVFTAERAEIAEKKPRY